MSFHLWARAGFAVLLAFACAVGRADDAPFPNRSVTLVVTFPAGGRSDVTARLLASRLQAAWNVPVVVSNRPGAGGAIGSRFVAEARPDGYTLLFTTSALLSAQYAVPNAPRLSDFAPIGMVEFSYPVLVARKGLNLSLASLRARPQSAAPLAIGMVPGATPQVLTDALIARTGMQATRVPFKGEAEMITALIGGHIDLATSSWAAVQNHASASTLEPVAIASPIRQPDVPGVPTLQEGGLDIVLEVFQAFFAPAGTPAPVVAALESSMAELMKDPTLAKDMKRLGLIPVWSGASASAAFMNRQDAQFKSVMKP